MNYRFLLPFAAIIFLFHEFFVNDAFAYIDPASGSAIIAMIVGVLAGIGMTLKMYWLKLKEKLSSKKI